MPLSLAGKAVAAVLAVGSVGVVELTPPDLRGQTVFFERLALRMDHARVIAPATAAQISEVVARARAHEPRGGDLDARRAQAIARIESALQAKTTFGGGELDAQSSPVARR